MKCKISPDKMTAVSSAESFMEDLNNERKMKGEKKGCYKIEMTKKKEKTKINKSILIINCLSCKVF